MSEDLADIAVTEYILAPLSDIYDHWRSVYKRIHSPSHFPLPDRELVEAEMGAKYGNFGETQLEKYLYNALDYKEDDPVLSNRRMESWYRLIDYLEKTNEETDWTRKNKIRINEKWTENIIDIPHPYTKAMEIGILAATLMESEGESAQESIRFLIKSGANQARIFMWQTIADTQSFMRVYASAENKSNAVNIGHLTAFLQYAVSLGESEEVGDMISHLFEIATDANYDPGIINGETALQMMNFLIPIISKPFVLERFSRGYLRAFQEMDPDHSDRDFLIESLINAKLKDFPLRNNKINRNTKIPQEKLEYAFNLWKQIKNPDIEESVLSILVSYGFTKGIEDKVRILYKNYLEEQTEAGKSIDNTVTYPQWRSIWYWSARIFAQMGYPQYLETDEAIEHLESGWEDNDLGFLIQLVKSYNGQNFDSDDKKVIRERVLGRLMNTIIKRVNQLMYASQSDTVSALALYEALMAYGYPTFPIEIH